MNPFLLPMFCAWCAFKGLAYWGEQLQQAMHVEGESQ